MVLGRTIVSGSPSSAAEIQTLVAPFSNASFAASTDDTFLLISPSKPLSTVMLIEAGLVKRFPTMFVR